MSATWCAHWRSCQPVTIAGLEAPSARSTRLPVSEATVLTPNASVTGPRTPTASGPIFSGSSGRAQADRGRQRERVVGGHLADPDGVESGVGRGQRDVHRLLVGTVEPERQDDFEYRSQHRHVGRLVEQDAARQVAGRLVDLEMGGGGEGVAEPTLQR